jgi:Protein of unknown function, DUF417
MVTKDVAPGWGENKMKLRVIAPLAMAVTAAAIGFAPIAAAAIGFAPIAAADATVHQNQGNAEITAHPGPAASHAAQLQQPFGGNMGALIFHHWRLCTHGGEALNPPWMLDKAPAPGVLSCLTLVGVAVVAVAVIFFLGRLCPPPPSPQSWMTAMRTLVVVRGRWCWKRTLTMRIAVTGATGDSRLEMSMTSNAATRWPTSRRRESAGHTAQVRRTRGLPDRGGAASSAVRARTRVLRSADTHQFHSGISTSGGRQSVHELALRDFHHEHVFGVAWRSWDHDRGAAGDQATCPEALRLGSVLAIGLFLATITFLFTTAGVGEATAGGFPVLSSTGQFLVKDVALVGLSAWTLADSHRAVAQRLGA